MKPQFFSLKQNHYSSDETKPSYKSVSEVYSEIGYEAAKLVHQDPNYGNTCAVRMSLALMKSGISIKGRLKIKGGRFAGRSVEPGAKLLADQIKSPALLGKPLIIQSPSAAPAELNGKQGLIFFSKIFGYGGGHIDLLETVNATQVCHSHCYFLCQEVWFWDLK